MPRLQRKPFSKPDEVREFPLGKLDVVEMDETSLARFTLRAGWVWSRDVAPIAGTPTCQHRHLGYTISGSLAVRMDDGTEMTIAPGDAFEIPPGHDAWVIGDVPWESIEFTAAHTYARPLEDIGSSVLATILFTDIVHSTAALEAMGDQKWSEVVREHNQRIRSVIDRHRGREMATTGDGFVALFDGAARGIQAAAAMDAAVSDLGIRVRVGVHTGEVAVAGGEARGIAVHAAARIADFGDAGDVSVSGTTCELVDGSGMKFRSLGMHELKGLTGPRPIFALER